MAQNDPKMIYALSAYQCGI